MVKSRVSTTSAPLPISRLVVDPGRVKVLVSTTTRWLLTALTGVLAKTLEYRSSARSDSLSTFRSFSRGLTLSLAGVARRSR